MDPATSTIALAIGTFVLGFILGRLSAGRQNSPSISQRLVQTQVSAPPPLELEDQLRQMLRQGNKIGALKRCREATGLGLKEAKEVVDAIEAGRTFKDLFNTSINTTE